MYNLKRVGGEYIVTDHEKKMVIRFDTLEDAIAYIEENGKKQRKESKNDV